MLAIHTVQVTCIGLRWPEPVQKLAWCNQQRKGAFIQLIWLGYSATSQADLILSESCFP